MSEPGRNTRSPTLRSMGNEATGSTKAATEVSVRKRKKEVDSEFVYSLIDTILCGGKKICHKTTGTSKQQPNSMLFVQNKRQWITGLNEP